MHVICSKDVHMWIRNMGQNVKSQQIANNVSTSRCNETKKLFELPFELTYNWRGYCI